MKAQLNILLLTAFLATLLSACGDDTVSDPGPQPTEPLIEPPVIVNDATTELKQTFDGLTLSEFLEHSFHQLLLRDPERVLTEGLAETLSFNSYTYTNISTSYQAETIDFYKAVLEKLESFDTDKTSQESAQAQSQNQHVAVYTWWLQDQLALKAYPEFQTTALNVLALDNFFLGLSPLTNEADASNYIEQLETLPTQYTHAITFLQSRQKQNIVDPNVVMQHVVNQMQMKSGIALSEDPIVKHFEQTINALDLTASQKASFIDRVTNIVESNIKPAQIRLTQVLEGMLSQAPVEIGLSQYPNGAAYYNTLLAHHLTTNMTADELYTLGTNELTRVQQDITTAFNDLGYPNEENIVQLYDRLNMDEKWIEKDDIASTFELLVQDARLNLPNAFSLTHLPDVLVVSSFQDGYFPAAKDGSKIGEFVTDASKNRPYYLMPSLAYHEAIPGHHLQSATAQLLDLPLLRTQPANTAYIEGWALYCERLAYELGWYEDNLAANLGRLQWEALRAARLIADVGVNTKGWNWNEAVSFLHQNTGLPENYVSDFVARFVVNPGQATAYTMGMTQLLELRAQQKQALGADFTLTDFHQRILNAGPMPLSLLAKSFNENKSQ